MDAILASLGEHYWEPGEDPWGGANLETGEDDDTAAGHGGCMQPTRAGTEPRAAESPMVPPVDPAEVAATIDAFMAASEPERRRHRFAHGIIDLDYDPITGARTMPRDDQSNQH